jgi:hypothetical protein
MVMKRHTKRALEVERPIDALNNIPGILIDVECG